MSLHLLLPLFTVATPQRLQGALQDYYAAHRAMPSFGAVAGLVGVSIWTVADAVAKLKTNGFLCASDTGRLQPGKRFFERQVLGVPTTIWTVFGVKPAPCAPFGPAPPAIPCEGGGRTAQQ